MTALVIVESPAKAKTISRFLGPEYIVEASYGHIRDLPGKAEQIPEKFKKEKWARLGVNVEKDFAPLYVIPDDKRKHVTRLKKALKSADRLLLATDEDREGESICWHLVEVLKPKVETQRIAFHEITKSAIMGALNQPREIASNLVRAQEGRRIVDRLFGYSLSPLLWKKVKRGLSAGRVQSVAVRLCVERERERKAFHSANFWGVDAEMESASKNFNARLNRIGDKKLAVGSDFNPDTGELSNKSKAVWLRSQADTEALIEAMQRPFTVRKVEEKPQTSRPAPPFTTATLQQEANRKLGMSARNTMRAAQRLYEGLDLDGERVGIITYMRTDSVNMAEQALSEAVEVISEKYGKEYTTGPRRYKTKSAGAQEAHEAIRPTSLARTPQELERFLDRNELRLYELIWKRTLASQMADAKLMRTAVEIESALDDGRPATFNASGKRIEFPGFLRAYVEGADDPDADIMDKEILLPELKVGQKIDPLKLIPGGHDTQPPARYTEASLVKKLEAEGVGRPSTYATIIDTIQNRGYVDKMGKALVPTFTAYAVIQLLEGHFAEYVDLKFTARMEQQLDEVAEGKLDAHAQLRAFFLGEGSNTPGLEEQIEKEEPNIEFPNIPIGTHPEIGKAMMVKVGRYGPYLQMGDAEDPERQTAPIPENVAPADLTEAQAAELLDKKMRGPRCVGDDPDTGMKIYAMDGRFGPYVQLGENPEKGDKKAPKPKRASLPKGVSEEEITLEQAIVLLSLPRELGLHPKSGEEIIASVSRFGPYVKCGSTFRSLEGEDDVYSIELERALEVLAKPAKKRGQREQKVLKDFGKNPESGAELKLLEGRYGPYVTDGSKNASFPKGSNVEEFNLDDAIKLIERNGREPKKKRGRKKAG